MGYEFFDEGTPDLGNPAAEARAVKKKAKVKNRELRPVAQWTSMDVAAHWKSEATQAYPMLAAYIGNPVTLAQVLAKRRTEYGETAEVQVEAMRRFLADPRNTRDVGRGKSMWVAFLGFLLHDGRLAKDHLDEAETRSAFAEAEETGTSDKNAHALAALSQFAPASEPVLRSVT
jgi:hypothetical protein